MHYHLMHTLKGSRFFFLLQAACPRVDTLFSVRTAAPRCFGRGPLGKRTPSHTKRAHGSSSEFADPRSKALVLLISKKKPEPCRNQSWKTQKMGVQQKLQQPLFSSSSSSSLLVGCHWCKCVRAPSCRRVVCWLKERAGGRATKGCPEKFSF